MAKHTSIRWDDNLHELLVAHAKANGRTVAQTVRFLLEKALNDSDR